jgi:hypothetical protein
MSAIRKRVRTGWAIGSLSVLLLAITGELILELGFKSNRIHIYYYWVDFFHRIR